MTVRNDQLYQLFREGAEQGMNHTETMEIKSVGEHCLLIGYDTQIYAHRSPDGEITKYTGWVEVDTSNTTNRQIEAFSADRTVDARPQIIDRRNGIVQANGAERIKKL